MLRLKRDVLKKSAVGVMWLNKEASGGDPGDNRGAGVDWDFSFGDHLKTGGFFARTATPGLEGDDWTAYADIVWDSPRSFLRPEERSEETMAEIERLQAQVRQLAGTSDR